MQRANGTGSLLDKFKVLLSKAESVSRQMKSLTISFPLCLRLHGVQQDPAKSETHPMSFWKYIAQEEASRSFGSIKFNVTLGLTNE